MNTSQKGINLIKQFEGLSLKVYDDAVGKPTIGYGHTGPDVFMGQTITASQAETILKADLTKFEKGVAELVKVPLNENQHAALISFSFNLGLGNLKSSTLLRKLNSMDYAGAANEFPRWDKARGKVLAGLTKRRNAEKELFLS